MDIIKYISGRVKSFGFAFIGLSILWKEANFKIHVFAFVLVVALSYYLAISATEWLFIVLASSLVFISEGINTAIEKTLDFVSTERNKKIASAKDISAAFVLISAINAMVVGGIIFIPKLINLFN